MTHAAAHRSRPALPELGEGLARIVDLALESATAIVLGLRRALSGGFDLTHARRMVRRMELIVRFALLIYAVNMTPTPGRRGLHPPARRLQTLGPQLHPRPARFAFTRGWRRSWRYDDEPVRPAPDAFAAAAGDPVAALRRRLEALAGVLANPAPLARRIARRVRREIIVAGWRPPKHPPPPAQREGHEELVSIFTEARFQLSEARRQWRAPP